MTGFYHIKVWRSSLSCFTIYGHGGHFGHVTSIMSSDFYFRVPESFMQSLVQIGTVVSEKIHEFLYVHNLGPRSRYDLDLQYSHIFINSMSAPKTFQVTGCNSF